MKSKRLIGSVVFCVVAVAGATVFWRGRPASAEDQGLLPGLVQGCKDAVNGIKSGKGTVRVHEINYSYDGDSPRVLETDGTYVIAFDGPKYKITGETVYLRNETASQNPILPGTKVLINIAFDGEKATKYNSSLHTVTIASPSTPGVEGLPDSFLVESMLVVSPGGSYGTGIRRIDVDSFARGETDKGLRVDRREWLGGRECIVVTRTAELTVLDRKATTTREYWVDPDRGFVTPRVREWGEGGPLKERATVFEANTGLREYGSTIWGPAKYTSDQRELDGNGGMRITRHLETTYDTDFRLNVPVTADDLTIKLPADAHVVVPDAEGSPSP